ncbi:MAG: alpha/beta hydrolase [Oscillospiraceae bacterium]|nr:alpha/beta hydrolase [Oscillospiraceae bacterium]
MKRVFIHGLGQSSSVWEETISQLNENEDILLPDLSDLIQDKEVNYENLYAAFSDFCSRSDEPVDLCGLSLGAVLALNYAIDYPDKVNSLVLIAAQYKMTKGLLRVQNFIFSFMPDSMFKSAGFKKSDFIQLCKTMSELDFSNSVKNISCPVLIVYGEKDSANKKASLELNVILENSELKRVSGSGHEVNVDAPEKLAVLLNDFYDRGIK